MNAALEWLADIPSYTIRHGREATLMRRSLLQVQVLMSVLLRVLIVKIGLIIKAAHKLIRTYFKA